jgi:hypothetical protein
MTIDKITTKCERRRINRTPDVPLGRNDATSLKQELDGWLTGRACWSHDEWTNLLTDLSRKGYSDLIETPKGQELIGRYLEQRKNGGNC